MNIGTAFVTTIEAHTAGDRATKARVTATYDMGGTLGSITFDVEIATARAFFVGQPLALSIEPLKETP